MDELRIEEVLNQIHKEILCRQGNGFTVEISAEVTKYLEWREPNLSYSTAKKRIYNIKHMDDFEVDGSWHTVDFKMPISAEIEKALPSGITIHKSPLVVLIERSKEEGLPRPWQSRYICSVEGHRVFLTVSDEYANQILLKQYHGECLFCHRLLTKHENILKEIATYFIDSVKARSRGIEFWVNSNQVYVEWYIGDSEYGGEHFFFEKWEMRPLNTTVEVYGMALALVATIRKMNPAWKNVEFRFSNGDTSTRIYFTAPSQPKAKTSKVLKNW